MKKLLLILVAAFALGCESRNQSSDRGAGSELEENAPVDPAESANPAEPDNTVHADTTTSGGMNRQNQYDTIQ